MGFIETIGYIVVGAGIVVLVALLFMIPTYFLWNWLMPKIFGLPNITLWQSLGLLILTVIFFRGSSSSSSN